MKIGKMKKKNSELFIIIRCNYIYFLLAIFFIIFKVLTHIFIFSLFSVVRPEAMEMTIMQDAMMSRITFDPAKMRKSHTNYGVEMLMFIDYAMFKR